MITTTLRGSLARLRLLAIAWLAGLALPVPAPAATITVGPGCSLVNAILSANANADTGGCAHEGVYGEDIVVLPNGTYGFSAPHSANTALPAVTSPITVVGNASTISRTNGAGAPFFRLFRVTGGRLTLLDLIIAGGRETDDAEGGAIHVRNAASLTLAGVTLSDNAVRGDFKEFAGRARGGAVYFESSGTLTLTDVTLSNNSADASGPDGGNAEGGAVYVEGDDGEGPAQVSLTDMVALDNRALANGTTGEGGTARGGAIYVESTGPVTIIRGLFHRNETRANGTGGNGGTAQGGAVYFEAQSDAASITLAELVVSENVMSATGAAPGNGGAAEGAVYLEAPVSGIAVRDSTFKINIANANALSGKNGGVAEGAGLAIESGGTGTATIIRSAFTQNTAFANGGTCTVGCGAGGANGGVGEGGGIRFDGGSGGNLAITSTTIASNSISCNATSGGGGVCEGGGINFDGGLLSLTNVTLTGNSTSATGQGACCSNEGGGFFIDSNATIQNSILAANAPTNCDKDDAADVITSLGNNIVDSVAGCGSPGPNDRIASPTALGGLVDTGKPGGVHRLPQAGSNALDAGNPAACPAIDQLGLPRQGTCDIGAAERVDAVPQATLLAAVLPASRSGLPGTVLTAFVTIINSSAGATAHQVGIALASAVPAVLGYQTTNASNALVGIRDTPVDIPPGGAQSFVIFLLPTGPFASTNLVLAFAGTNTAPVTAIVGLNTFLASASVTAIPDVVALGATIGNTGIVDVTGGAGVFSVATVNIGASGAITVSANTGSAPLGLALFVCETNPQTSVCKAPPAPSVTVDIPTNATPTFAIFVNAAGVVPFDPAVNRVFVFFVDALGVIRGGTSVAVRTV